MRLFLIFCGALFLAGCASSDRRAFMDVKAPDRMNDYQEQLWAEGDTLFIQIKQLPGYNIANFDTIVHDGNLYLEKQVVRSGGASPRMFRLDLSRLNLPSDWAQRVYWVEGRTMASASHTILTGDPDAQAVMRRKVHVSTSPRLPFVP